MIEGTYLGIQHMSTNNGGRGGTIVNVASLGGKEVCNGGDRQKGQKNKTNCQYTRYSLL